MSARLICPAFLLLISCSLQAKPPHLQLLTTEVPLAEIYRGTVYPSDDFRHVAALNHQQTNVAVCVDAEPAREYDDVGWVGFSPDSKQTVFSAVRNGKSFTVVNGHEGKFFDAIAYKGGKDCPFEFSPDSRRLAYVVTEGDIQKVVVDGREAEQSYERIENGSLKFSPDSKHLAYAGRRGTYSHVVFDGAEGPAWDAINLERNSPDGVDLPPMVFSGDSKHFAYEAKRGGESVIVLDGKILAHGEVHGLVFSPNGRRVACVQDDDRNDPLHFLTRVVVDGVAGEPVEGEVTLLTFSPNSERIVCLRRHIQASTEDRTYTILSINDKENRQYQEIAPESFQFSADGKHMGFLTGEKRKKSRLLAWLREKIPLKLPDSDDDDDERTRFFVVVDGKYRVIQADALDNIAFSADLRRWGIVTETDTNQCAIVDGKRIGPYATIEPTKGEKEIRCRVFFSPDSRHYALQASNQKGAVLVVDGVEKVINGKWRSDCNLVFDTPTHLHGLFSRSTSEGRERIFRLEVDLIESR
ncbi:MAG: hypothetical protein ABSH38_14575 [Verrucomicrobiota bacterium]|jgi:WD40 repeat protein